MATLTAEQKKEYVANGGGACPHCGGGDLESSRLEADGNIAWAAVHCEGCGKRWKDEYTLTGVSTE